METLRLALLEHSMISIGDTGSTEQFLKGPNDPQMVSLRIGKTHMKSPTI